MAHLAIIEYLPTLYERGSHSYRVGRYSIIAR
jgi:hypothetical protein